MVSGTAGAASGSAASPRRHELAAKTAMAPATITDINTRRCMIQIHVRVRETRLSAAMLPSVTKSEKHASVQA